MAISKRNPNNITSYMSKFQDDSGDYDPFSVQWELFREIEPDAELTLQDFHLGRVDNISQQAYGHQELDFLLLWLNDIGDDFYDMVAGDQFKIISPTTVFELFEAHKNILGVE